MTTRCLIGVLVPRAGCWAPEVTARAGAAAVGGAAPAPVIVDETNSRAALRAPAPAVVRSLDTGIPPSSRCGSARANAPSPGRILCTAGISLNRGRLPRLLHGRVNAHRRPRSACSRYGELNTIRRAGNTTVNGTIFQ